MPKGWVGARAAACEGGEAQETGQQHAPCSCILRLGTAQFCGAPSVAENAARWNARVRLQHSLEQGYRASKAGMWAAGLSVLKENVGPGSQGSSKAGGERENPEEPGSDPAEPGWNGVDMERGRRRVAFTCGASWCPGCRLPASHLPPALLQTTRPARSVLGFSLFFFGSF